MSAVAFTSPRYVDRMETTWNAECHIGKRVLLGRVLDVTNRGVFFRPELGLQDGIMWGPHEGSDAAEIGDEVVLKLVHRVTPDVEVMGQVRWTGSSENHSVAGFGVEFLSPPGQA